MTDTGVEAAGDRARRIGMYVLAAPIILVMGSALLRDPGRIGEESSASGMPLIAFVVLAGVVSGLMVGVWACSDATYRTPVLLLQLVVVWGGGLLYQQEIRVDVTVWDVVEDAVLLGTTVAQLLPRRRTPTT